MTLMCEFLMGECLFYVMENRVEKGNMPLNIFRKFDVVENNVFLRKQR